MSKPVTSARIIENYKKAVRKNFSFMKQTRRFDDLLAKSIHLAEGEGYLVPVCELHATDNRIIATLAQWRKENAFAYPTQFTVTIAGTASWLRSQVLDVEDRILFLVLDKHGNPIGHIGFAHAINDEGEMEFDNIVRGVKNVQPGMMSHAAEALLNWAEETIAPHAIYLRVFSDNDHAIEFYHKLGFKDDGLLPLRRHVDGDKVNY